MKAMIMAGGEGSRLRPLTCRLPKPLVPVVGRPVMAYALDLLKKHGFDEVGVTLQYMPDAIQDAFGQGKSSGVSMRYYIEHKPLGTAGSVKQAEHFLDDTFIVLSGDALTDVDLTEALAFHKAKKAMATLVLKSVDVPLEYGLVITDADERVLRFVEKPGWGQVFSDTVNTGIYILEPSVLARIPADGPFDFGKELFPKMVEEGLPVYGYTTDAYWCDIGDITQYLQAQRDVLHGRVNVRIDADEIAPGVWAKAAKDIHKDVRIEAPCYIGNARLSGCHIAPETVIGDGVRIAPGASVSRSVLWPGARVGEDAWIRGSILCHDARVEAQAVLMPECVVGDGAVVEKGAELAAGAKLWPKKRAAGGQVLLHNIIEADRPHTPFQGDWAHASQLEDVILIACAYAGLLDGGKMVIGHAAAHQAEMRYHAVIGAGQCGGAGVEALGAVSRPMLGYAIRQLGAKGGIFVDEAGRLLLVDALGVPISRDMQRKLEGFWARQDYKRAKEDDLLPVKSDFPVETFYLAHLARLSPKVKEPGFTFAVKTRDESFLTRARQLFQDSGQRLWQNEHPSKDKRATVFELMDDQKLRIFIGGEALNDYQLQALLVETALWCGVSTFYLPLTQSDQLDERIQKAGGKVVRTRSGEREWMRQCLEDEQNGPVLAALFFDALASAYLILQYAAHHERDWPEAILQKEEGHQRYASVDCVSRDKGRVLRLIAREAGGGADLNDGVRVRTSSGWALILPSADTDQIKVYSESADFETAKELCDFYVRRIESIRTLPPS